MTPIVRSRPISGALAVVRRTEIKIPRMVFDGPNNGRPSKNMVPASSGKEKREPKIFFATIGVPFANVNSTNNGRICKSRIPATYLSRRRLSFNSPVGVSPIRCFAELRVRGVHLADWPGLGNGPAGAGRARRKARKAEVTRSNRVGCARKACADRAGTVAGFQRGCMEMLVGFWDA